MIFNPLVFSRLFLGFVFVHSNWRFLKLDWQDVVQNSAYCSSISHRMYPPQHSLCWEDEWFCSTEGIWGQPEEKWARPKRCWLGIWQERLSIPQRVHGTLVPFYSKVWLPHTEIVQLFRSILCPISHTTLANCIPASCQLTCETPQEHYTLSFSQQSAHPLMRLLSGSTEDQVG
jgi:hypothetical protein